MQSFGRTAAATAQVIGHGSWGRRGPKAESHAAAQPVHGLKVQPAFCYVLACHCACLLLPCALA